MEFAIAIVSFATAVISLIEAWKSKKLATQAITINESNSVRIKELEQIIISQKIRYGGINLNGISAIGNHGDGVHIVHNQSAP